MKIIKAENEYYHTNMSYKEIHLPSSVNPRAVTVPQAEDQAEGGEYRGLQHRRPRGGGVQVARQGRDEDGRLTFDLKC